MAVSFKIPKSPQKSILTIDEFKGVDFTNSPASVDENKSPNAINMIRDVPGKVRKRMGYEVVEDWGSGGQNIRNYFDVNVEEGQSPFSDIYISNTEDKTVNYNGEAIGSGLGHAVNQIGLNIYLNPGSYVVEYIRTSDTYPVLSNLPAGALNTYFYFDINYTTEATSKTGRNIARIELLNGNQDIDDERKSVTVTLSEPGYLVVEANMTAQAPTTPSPIYATYTFDNVEYGINVIKADEYEPDMPYIPYNPIIENLNINGCHFRREDEIPLYHIGTTIAKDGTVLYTGANDARSHSWQFDDKLYILDGKRFLVYDGTTVEPVENIAYIPLTYTDREPIHGNAGGGGKKVDDINLLQPQFTNEFIVTEDWSTAKQFPLSVEYIDRVSITVEVLDSNGEWQPKTVTTDYTVDYDTGIVTFVTAPGVTPIRGVSNVRITASKTREGYADRINKCTFGTRFGVNGAFDRLFVSGNPDYPNSDWYSEEWDCSYFPDTSYSKLGSSKSAVVGYSIVSNYLAAHKDELEEDLSIIVREGDLVTNDSGIDKPSFRIINTLQGAGAIATESFAYLCTEPLFLTRSGLYAVTAQDITGEKYAQSRSFYLNGKLTKEDFSNLQKSFAIIYDDMYILCVNHDAVDEQGNPCVASRLYILDGLQPMRTDKSEPYSTRQYAAFYCEMENIRCMWERENRLYFGTATGKICRFFNDKKAQGSYNDDGHAIVCQWETPDIDGQLFYKNKSLRYIALRAGSAIATSVEIWGMDRGIWKFIKRDDTFGRYLSFEDIDFSKFTFSCDQTEQLARAKVRIKKVDKYRLRFINNELNEPFVIYNIANEYVENGNYKG